QQNSLNVLVGFTLSVRKVHFRVVTPTWLGLAAAMPMVPPLAAVAGSPFIGVVIINRPPLCL
ncbi:hypothetical protein, partial [Gluconobacter cerinus]|uniref:hypothetical protein n=1 Tax=Gluconobacter cerinus TaxID=38307 RepID=UPI001B8B7E09